MTRRIILIGGMPTAGKSTITKQLSQRLGLPWMSSDQIREIMKSAIDPNVNSALSSSINMSADDYFAKYTPREIAEMEYEQGVATWPGISFMINNDWTWREGFIIEGVNILPKLVAHEQSKRNNIQALFLSDSNVTRTKDVIHTRGLYSKADSYADIYKEKELEWVRLFDDIIRQEAEEFKQPIVEVSKNTTDIEAILMSLDQS